MPLATSRVWQDISQNRVSRAFEKSDKDLVRSPTGDAKLGSQLDLRHTKSRAANCCTLTGGWQRKSIQVMLSVTRLMCIGSSSGRAGAGAQRG